MVEKKRLIRRLAAGGVMALIPSLARAGFSPNNLAVLDSTTSATSTDAVAVRVEQFSKSGTAQSSSFTVELPSGSTGTRLTMSADVANGSDGGLDLSNDGRFLSVVGYNVQAGTASVTSTTGARFIGRIDSAGNTDLTTSNTVFSSPTATGMRGDASADGSRFWFTGASGGIVTSPLGDSGAGATVQSGGGSGAKALHVFGSRLYGITNSTLFTYGNTLPTAGDTRSNISGVTIASGANDFYMLDRDATVPGLDTLYVAGTSGIYKYSFDGTTWTARGGPVGATNYLGIAAEPDGLNADLYLVTPGGLFAVSDTAASNATISLSSVTTLATPDAGTAFRNVEFSPAAVPEPGTLLTLSIAGVGLLARRRRGLR